MEVPEETTTLSRRRAPRPGPRPAVARRAEVAASAGRGRSLAWIPEQARKVRRYHGLLGFFGKSSEVETRLWSARKMRPCGRKGRCCETTEFHASGVLICFLRVLFGEKQRKGEILFVLNVTWRFLQY